VNRVELEGMAKMEKSVELELESSESSVPRDISAVPFVSSDGILPDWEEKTPPSGVQWLALDT